MYMEDLCVCVQVRPDIKDWKMRGVQAVDDLSSLFLNKENEVGNGIIFDELKDKV